MRYQYEKNLIFGQKTVNISKTTQPTIKKNSTAFDSNSTHNTKFIAYLVLRQKSLIYCETLFIYALMHTNYKLETNYQTISSKHQPQKLNLT